MTNDADKLTSLLAYVQAEGRVCPRPQHWNALWEMLPAKERIGVGWEPALPLILGAWWDTSAIEKQLRLREHIEHAAQHGVLDAVDSFLRSLMPDQWHTLEDA
jgi:hypothetical protein